MTIFEKILNNEIPSQILYEDDFAIAIPDIQPQLPVHVLVIPKTFATSLSDIGHWSSEQTAGYFQSIDKVAKHLQIENGYRVVFNTGSDAGQTVAYLHAHILAGSAMGWPPFSN
jgi:histidine triad (HIT) family protein